MSNYYKPMPHYNVQIESDQDGTSLTLYYSDGYIWRAYYPEIVWGSGSGTFTVGALSATANSNLEACARMIETLTEEIVDAIPYEPLTWNRLTLLPESETEVFHLDDPADEWFAENPWDFEVKPTSAYHNLDGVDVITPLRDDNGNLIGLEVIPSEDHVSTSDSCRTLAHWFDVDVSVYPGTYANG